MADKERQIRNSAIYMFPLLVGSILPFVSLSIFTRILTKQDFGVFALAQVVGIFLSGIGNLGMTAAYDRNFFKYRNVPQKNAQLLFTVLIFVMGNFLVLSAATFYFRHAISDIIIGLPDYGNVIFYVVLAQFLTASNYYYLAYYKNSGSAGRYAIPSIGLSVINLVCALFFVAYLKIGVVGLAYSQLIAGLVIFVMLHIKFLSSLPISFSGRLLREMLHIAYPLTPRIFIGVISSQFDKYMIGLLESVGA